MYKIPDTNMHVLIHAIFSLQGPIAIQLAKKAINTGAQVGNIDISCFEISLYI